MLTNVFPLFKKSSVVFIDFFQSDQILKNSGCGTFLRYTRDLEPKSNLYSTDRRTQTP